MAPPTTGHVAGTLTASGSRPRLTESALGLVQTNAMKAGAILVVLHLFPDGRPSHTTGSLLCWLRGEVMAASPSLGKGSGAAVLHTVLSHLPGPPQVAGER